ncbi:MAG: response regulator [Bacteroidetes bacterium]|nr:MAG: response regulator [Bacteroidota bacterium]
MSKSQPHIILVDDNEIDLFLHEKLIKLAGISNHVDKFLSGKAALDYLQNTTPDIILLDIQMPEMDGFEFLSFYDRFYSDREQETRIFMVSSSLDFGDISKAKASPLVSEFIKKPLNIVELKEALGREGF